MGETTTYAGRYVPGLQHGGERTELSCTTTTPNGGTSHVVLASGPRVVLDWETTADKATIAAAVLRHWLTRQSDPDELHDFLDQLTTDWATGTAWEITGQQLRAAGFVP
ncbi:hypothetical protein GKE82_26335 [Conexibacter sp. W3-3-2]|uniref:hypothetical protein n=1 Tax=Conexibacter sp. W3-3-2 TaxID=2675227 RepID=UPI0012B7FB90|nr:hypothetical protein [Conexibacter sp. W3-3-2]MTD47635.1 hypothetical protein [Conexibacter sp. W3-3-2]MTD47723.1 hypothetical protein [Conexibacter sp. W3-3-2]